MLAYLASEEMKSLFDWNEVKKKVKIFEPQFMVENARGRKTIVVYTKMCRGAMANYIITNKITDIDDLLAFEYEGFKFAEWIDNGKTPLFVRQLLAQKCKFVQHLIGGPEVRLRKRSKYIADPETQLADITYWTLGSLVKVLSSDLFAIAPVIAAGCLMVLLLSWRINILSLGEQEARALGVHVGFVRGVVIICSTLLTASAVCVCGTIGWVGLVIPHLSRITVGQDNTKSIPVSLLMGAIFMVAIDTLARVLMSLELPLSILTGIIGAPFYFMVLAGQRMSLS